MQIAIFVYSNNKHRTWVCYLHSFLINNEEVLGFERAEWGIVKGEAQDKRERKKMTMGDWTTGLGIGFIVTTDFFSTIIAETAPIKMHSDCLAL